jgi:outer membrane lipoprotein-sorting protein
MIRKSILFFSFLFFLALSNSLLAQETPESLAQKLQAHFLSAQGMELSFNIKGEGRITVMADVQGKRVRIESPKLLIISDGKTVWNYEKSTDRVTIDNAAPSSVFHDPTGLFRFADNYTAKIVETDSIKNYSVEFTPLPQLAPLFKAAGDMQKLTLDIRFEKSGQFRISSASAKSANGVTRTEEVLSLNRIHQSDFVFTPKSTTKVIDLRE